MLEELYVDRNSDTPIYKQIIEQITSMVQKGKLKAGDKLPPERELANAMLTSRGTINKAYEELERNKVIEVIRGSGSFVSKKQDVLEKGRKEQAIQRIDEMLESLVGLKFSFHEINTLTQIRIMEREKGLVKVRIAGVDCNPEALSIFKNQLSYISNVAFSKFLLSQIKEYDNPEEFFEEYDIILTTSTHYGDLSELLSGLEEKIIQAAVSPSQQTIIDLATIPADAAIGIICRSWEFLNIIKNRLKSFDVKMKNVSHMFEGGNPSYAEFIANKDILIIPPEFEREKDEKYIHAIEQLKNRNGKVIRFEYQIERGSLIYIEEEISKVLGKK